MKLDATEVEARRRERKPTDRLKIDAVIIEVLKKEGRPTHRTRLVKLVYLIDHIYHRHFGQTLTGLSYMWDYFGPNAVSNAIVDRGDRLCTQKLLHLTRTPNQYGDFSYLYSLETPDVASPVELEPAALLIIDDVVRKYRNSTLEQLVRASKRTEPFRRARPFEVLKMEKSSTYEDLEKDIEADPQFSADIRESIEHPSDGTTFTIHELEALYGG